MGNLRPVSKEAALGRREFVTTSLATGFALAAQPVIAQTMITTDPSGLVAGEVSITVKGQKIPAYRAMPASGGPFPVVLVAQEIFGVHEHIKDVCRRLAKQGYMAIAVELYFRQGDVTKLPDAATIFQQVVNNVPDSQVMGDLDAAVAWAKASGKGDTRRLAITGFCWGGRIVWLYAAHNKNLKAAVAWYGPILRGLTANNPQHPLHLAGKVNAPVLGLYGGADAGIPNDTVDMMRFALQAAGKTKSTIHTYPDTPHAFHADYRATYRKNQAEDGWKRLLAWLKQHGV